MLKQSGYGLFSSTNYHMRMAHETFLEIPKFMRQTSQEFSWSNTKLQTATYATHLEKFELIKEAN